MSEDSSWRERLGLLLDYLDATDFSKIARRYFALNFFDGVLTMMGFTLGYYMVGGRDPHAVFGAGIAASVAMGLSGLVGALMTEMAERERDLRELEKSLFKDLGNSVIAKSQRMAAVLIAIIDAAAPALGALMLAIPLAYPLVDMLGYDYAIAASVAIGLVSLFALGSYLGSGSRRGMLKYGVAMLLAGVSLAIITALMGVVL